MGLRYVKGLGETDWESIARERRAASFASVDDFVRRTTLDEGVLGMLAEAGGFDGFDIDRRTALWDVRRLARARDESLPISPRERMPLFESLSAFEEVKWDYRTTAHSPRRHPLAPLRAMPYPAGVARCPYSGGHEKRRENSLCWTCYLSPATGNRRRRRIS